MKGKGLSMVGEQVGESKGKRLVRRILSVEPATAVVRADGAIFGQGQGLIITADGQGITWTGSGVGHFGWEWK
jgi:hypothetical protein